MKAVKIKREDNRYYLYSRRLQTLPGPFLSGTRKRPLWQKTLRDNLEKS